jgi:hypothetical protein
VIGFLSALFFLKFKPDLLNILIYSLFFFRFD